MKIKLLIILVFFISGGNTIAQKPVQIGQNMLRNEAQNSVYVVFNPEEKKVVQDLEEFIKEYGRLVETEKHSYKLANVKIPSISSRLKNIEILFEEYKNVLRVAFFFTDDKDVVLNSFSFDKDAAKKFVQDFSVYSDKRLSKELSNENLKMISDKVVDTQKEIKKIEKRLETNLKYQEKYGKVLDASPEQLSQALSQKEELVEILYNSDSSQIPLDTKAEEELKKQATRKEKEIIKIQKKERKNEKKLEKKEREFDELKDELFSTKKYLKNIEKVEYDTKKSIMP